MASFIVEGNHRLHGEIIPQGAKNEALEVICATMLTSEEVVIENVPDEYCIYSTSDSHCSDRERLPVR